MTVAKNNAFGAGAPSWNVSFPMGNLTAAEILAYFPHWLKSLDVIFRFVEHGGRAPAIAYLINKYRTLPRGDFHGNSVTVMMQYAVRQAGNEGWTIARRNEFNPGRTYPETSLFVGDFRPPRLTHPKTFSKSKPYLTHNKQADPIPFKDLALHIKEHPTGNDALDLTRCVLYALGHPNEEWYFPDDFNALVDHLGGKATVTHLHRDRQLFMRYSNFHGKSPARPPRAYKRKSEKAKGKAKEIESESDIDGEATTDEDSQITRPLLHSTMADPTSATLGSGLGPRRSSRRVKNTPIYAEKDGNITDDNDADYTTPRKKRQLNGLPRTPQDEGSDFEAKSESDSEEDSMPTSDEHIHTAFDEQVDTNFHEGFTVFGGRHDNREPFDDAFARQFDVADQGFQMDQQESDLLMQQFQYARANAQAAHPTFDIMQGTGNTAFFSPPVLPQDHLIINDSNVHLLAHYTCRSLNEQRESAFGFYRFGGPRQSQPYRELYRLTAPYDWDTSDWAENVRWALEQHTLYGSVTWTEEAAHLETIDMIRQNTMWISETALMHRLSLPLEPPA